MMVELMVGTKDACWACMKEDRWVDVLVANDKMGKE